MFFYIEPEVAGGIGPKSETHRKNGKLVVTRLNYELSGWLGDAPPRKRTLLRGY